VDVSVGLLLSVCSSEGDRRMRSRTVLVVQPMVRISSITFGSKWSAIAVLRSQSNTQIQVHISFCRLILALPKSQIWCHTNTNTV
jgi:hypothetical protein